MVIFTLLFKFSICHTLKACRCTSKLIYICIWTISSSWSNFGRICCMKLPCYNLTNWLSVPLGELTVKASKWPVNFILLMNVIAGIYSTIAYILVTIEAYIFLSNHDTNDISPLWPLFHVWNYRISGKIPSNTVNESLSLKMLRCRSLTTHDSAIDN